MGRGRTKGAAREEEPQSPNWDKCWSLPKGYRIPEAQT